MTDDLDPTDDDPGQPFEEVAQAHAALKGALPALTEARRRWYASRTETDREEMDRQQALVEALSAEFKAKVDEIRAGMSPEMLALVDAEPEPRDIDRRARRTLTADQIAPTATI